MIDYANSTVKEAAFRIARKMRANIGKNQKLGEGVASFSLPHGRSASCVDATDQCLEVCYADNFLLRRPAILDSYQENFAITKRADFDDVMTLALSMLPLCLLRIHVVGDFYSVKYIDDWAAALKYNPHITPFGFTRAWRDILKREAFERNEMTRYIMASVDDETGPAPPGWRVARMVSDVTIFDIKRGRKAIPTLLCNEQIPSIRQTCADCGRCPLAKLTVRQNRLQIVPLTKIADVNFALH